MWGIICYYMITWATPPVWKISYPLALKAASCSVGVIILVLGSQQRARGWRCLCGEWWPRIEWRAWGERWPRGGWWPRDVLWLRGGLRARGELWAQERQMWCLIKSLMAGLKSDVQWKKSWYVRSLYLLEIFHYHKCVLRLWTYHMMITCGIVFFMINGTGDFPSKDDQVRWT